MAARQPRYSKEEFAHRGQALYEKCVRPRVERGNRGRIVAIDIETGEFEVGDDALAASGQLLTRCPDAQPWCVRIGHQAMHRFEQLHGNGRRSICIRSTLMRSTGLRKVRGEFLNWRLIGKRLQPDSYRVIRHSEETEIDFRSQTLQKLSILKEYL